LAGDDGIYIEGNDFIGNRWNYQEWTEMRVLFLPKLLPRSTVIGGPILVFHRIKNLSRMGYKITLIAPVLNDLDRADTSL
jgi:hypothetical protein